MSITHIKFSRITGILGVIGLIAIGAVGFRFKDAIAAATGINTQQAITAAPVAMNMSGLDAGEGVSVAFAKADHVHPISGILSPINGGTGLSVDSGTFIMTNALDGGQINVQAYITGKTDYTQQSTTMTVIGGLGSNDGMDIFGGDSTDGGQSGFGLVIWAGNSNGGSDLNADGGVGGSAFLAFGTGEAQGLTGIGGPRNGWGLLGYGGCQGEFYYCGAIASEYVGDGVEGYGYGGNGYYGVRGIGGTLTDGGGTTTGVRGDGSQAGGNGGQFYAHGGNYAGIITQGGPDGGPGAYIIGGTDGGAALVLSPNSGPAIAMLPTAPPMSPTTNGYIYQDNVLNSFMVGDGTYSYRMPKCKVHALNGSGIYTQSVETGSTGCSVTDQDNAIAGKCKIAATTLTVTIPGGASDNINLCYQ